MFKISECSPYVYNMFTVCLQYVYCMFAICLLYVCIMFTLCLQYVYCMFTICLLYVYNIFRLDRLEEAVKTFTSCMKSQPFFLDGIIARGNVCMDYGTEEGLKWAM